MNKSLILSALLCVASFTSTPVFAGKSGSWLPGETPAQQDARMAWWREAKFGMFIHWGIYSIAADGEWHMRKQTVPFAEYSKYAAQFNPVKFNADEWMSLAHDAGMKYAVFTTKHHDGFAMFKSQASDYNIVDATPFKRDVVKELSEACPRHDVRLGLYYSFLSDWGHKGGGAGCPHWDPAFQDGDLHEYIQKVAMVQLKELLSNYGPISEMWFDRDGKVPITPEESAQVIDLLKMQPNIIVDPRLPGVTGDFSTPERYQPSHTPDGDWELCTTVNGTWGYTKAKAKPPAILLPLLVNAWGMGGNVLMNVGPDAQGLIPDDSAQSLREIGAWLKIYGKSIYGSTAGPFPYLPWGTATRKGDTLYLQVIDWPADGKLKIPLISKVGSALLLGSGKPVKLKIGREHGRMILHLPARPPHPVVNVVALSLKGEPQVDYLSVIPGKTSNSFEGPKTLEFDAGKPVTIATMRLAATKFPIKSLTLEFKQDQIWKPILSGFEKPAYDSFDRGPAFVTNFPPVTAQEFRLKILETEQPGAIKSLELYPVF